MNKTDAMKKIRDEVWALTCPLAEERTKGGVHAVIGEGAHDAKILFVGEAPGRTEAATGRPFCGAAGKILDELLASIDLPRKEVYITNVVKDRPPMNRDPLPEEIALYGPFLLRQIEIIRPRVIAMLGRFSMRYIFDNLGFPAERQTISQIHGSVYDGTASYGTIKIVPLYHPAVVVYDRSKLDELKKDFAVLKELAK